MADGAHINWPGARREYEAAIASRASIARKYGISYAELRVRASVNKWSEAKRSSSTDRMILIERIMGAIELQIDNLEKRDMTPTGEKEAAVLSKLTNSLDALIAMSKAEAGSPDTERETVEMRDIRRQLAKRIDALTKA